MISIFFYPKKITTNFFTNLLNPPNTNLLRDPTVPLFYEYVICLFILSVTSML